MGFKDKIIKSAEDKSTENVGKPDPGVSIVKKPGAHRKDPAKNDIPR